MLLNVCYHGYCQTHFNLAFNLIDDVMVSVVDSSAVDRGFEPWSGLAEDCKNGICCFSAKHASLWSKSKEWLDRNQNNVSN